MALQVLNLKAENYKRLRAVDITPEGNVVFIGGRNAQGKTSVLDAIWAALAGGEASRATQQPIRDGQDSAVVSLDLGDMKVTRRWTKDDSGTLIVEAADGARYSSPQKVLDQLIGARAFDPLAFTRQSARDQVATLVSTVDLPFDPDELERERKGVFDRRTEISREVAKLEGQLAGYPSADPSLPDAEESVADVLAERERARANNEMYDRATAAEKRLLAEVDELEEKLREKMSDLALLQAAALQLDQPVDLAPFDERLANIEATNARIRQQQHRVAVASELAERKGQAAQHTLALMAIEKRKADALAAVEFPVPGLSFDDSGVTYNGIPFAQASAAEQLRVSVALAMAANPTLRVLRILDGSLLDSASLETIAALAAEHEYQVWIEVVDETGGVGFVIEDGEVRS
ncbi:ATP-binding protein [Agromyces ramosus]|uniref:Recombinational DNA repair ATPase RecF n=1 Tax=Agromyces ramosus TaxID=33879 RepID=A0ABU0R9M0_9MICO|nr:ATP-binding protein [Agromyces ramosus]MDQ0894462.1 recombinational DNA repair ATPase RecF [Agromyces ramosus]